MSTLSRCLPLVLAALGCGQLFAQETPPPPAAEEAEPVKEVAASESPGALPALGATPARYAIPFAWETSPEEPLAKARQFIAELLRANESHAALGRAHFAPFADAETPRATVLTCADSRVQTNAWDPTPENDDFTVRNLGNQLTSGLGSIEYGIQQLHTPVLVIMGHTGCSAVKAALEKPEGLSPALQAEIGLLQLPPSRPGATAEQALSEAVLANVHAQVTRAVQHFGPFVHSGELTVVGAVYDFRNDLGHGHGRLQIVNVNTNAEPARIEAFIRAVRANEANEAKAKGDDAVRLAPDKLAKNPVYQRVELDPRLRAAFERARSKLAKGGTTAVRHVDGAAAH